MLNSYVNLAIIDVPELFCTAKVFVGLINQ